MDTNEEVWTIARNAAFRVDFVTTGRELHLYMSAIYSAIMWGWEKRIEEKEREARPNDELMSNNTKTLK